MFRSSYKIATVWGIPIKVHISLILIVLFLASDFGLFNGTLLGIGLAVSIVLHELGHSFVALQKGCRVREITLMCLGGAAQMERIPTKPLDEALMAMAGPLVSLFVGIVCLWGGGHLPLPPLVYPWNIVHILGAINLGLVAFNLLPAFPMDGGRVFRAVLTPKFGRLRATFIAARLGKIMAILFGIYGFFTHSWMLVFIAFFIFTIAGNEYRMVQIQEAAKHQGSGTWSPFENLRRRADGDNDKVTISPPPYEKGPGLEADVHSADDDSPFKKLF